MQEDFLRIKKEYGEFHKTFLVKGKFPQRETKSGYWATSDPDTIFELFKRINLQNYNSFIDLGSGDGLVVAIASIFTKAAGIESDEKLIGISEKIKAKLNLNCSFKQSDYLKQDIKEYDLIYINPDNYFHKLEPKLEKEGKGKTLVAWQNIYQPLYLKPIKKEIMNTFIFNIFKL